MKGRIYGYYHQALNYVKIICYDTKLYAPKILQVHLLYWFHLYRNRPGGFKLADTTQQVWYFKGIVIQADLYVKPLNICKKFKNSKGSCGNLPPKIIAYLKLWNSVHIYLIVPFYKSIIQRHTDGTTIQKGVRLICMMMLDTATGWFDIFEVPLFGIDEVSDRNYEYIDTSSSRFIQIFNHTCLCIYHS